MRTYIGEFLSNPKQMLIFFLLAFPGRILAISAHEYAHAYIADKCGDPTARLMGRLTLNPFAHLDLMGAVMMLLVGFGWAKPVPINPRNYRNARRDDLKVSLAGISMNLIMFLIGFLLLFVFACAAMKKLPYFSTWLVADGDTFITRYFAKPILYTPQGYLPILDLFKNLPYISDYLIAPAFGRMAGYVFQMIAYFVQTNIVLAMFNLLPVPPLDGWHVLNDLWPRNPLFTTQKSMRYASLALLILVLSGILGTGFSYVMNGVFSGLGHVWYALAGLLKLF